MISVVTDVLSRRILDWVTYPAMALLLGVRLAFWGVGTWETGFLTGLLSALGLMAFFALLAWRGRMGWGDVKLMGVVGAAVGFPQALWALACIALVGAGQALVTLLWQGQLAQMFQDAGRRWAVRLRLLPKDAAPKAARHIPYAVAIALGTVWGLIYWESTGTQTPLLP